MTLPPWIVLDPSLKSWLLEDIGRGDRATQGLLTAETHQGKAEWIIKEAGIIAGLPVADRVFHLLNSEVVFTSLVKEGEFCESGMTIARLEGALDALLMGERVALNLVMRLSGIASVARQYVDAIADLPARFADTRKTTPGLRLLEKYATRIGGASNHRMGLDDAAMIKDNHIQAAGGVGKAIARVRTTLPYPLTIEVETSNLIEVKEAIEHPINIIMLDNMKIEMMKEAVEMIRDRNSEILIEASGNITLKTIREVAKTGVDYISSSAPITRSHWLDLSMRFV
ncbi:MAG: carboxylating nicotinate-nucleotide diphosphorylase [Cyanobacteria bacterium SBLK]|nr:carboxylating nicotinate-nucleotide diphosphorylase [Cyanobacteria bacterium SBLK]